MGNKLTRKCTIGLTDYKVHFPLTLPAVIDNPIELRQLNLEASLLGTLTDIIVVHGDEQNHSSNVKADMTDWFMHQKYKEFKELSIHAEAVAKQMTEAIKGSVEDITSNLTNSFSDAMNNISQIQQKIGENMENTILQIDEAHRQELENSLQSLGIQLASLSKRFVDDYSKVTASMSNLIVRAQS